MRVGGLEESETHIALSRAFGVAAEIHRLMSFQEEHSDVSRLNREAHLRAVTVDAHTYTVLERAAEVSRQSDGAFDITVAPQLDSAASYRLGAEMSSPDASARWSDVDLLSDRRVRFARPLWIDVSGIAKGYAVDRAMIILRESGAGRACVNAGGDMAASGDEAENVLLRVGLGGEADAPVIRLQNESLASSGARGGVVGTMHIDGIERRRAPARFVSVVAPRCVMADALTKVVMARGESARTALRHFGATALMSTGDVTWSEIS